MAAMQYGIRTACPGRKAQDMVRYRKAIRDAQAQAGTPSATPPPSSMQHAEECVEGEDPYDPNCEGAQWEKDHPHGITLEEQRSMDMYSSASKKPHDVTPSKKPQRVGPTDREEYPIDE